MTLPLTPVTASDRWARIRQHLDTIERARQAATSALCHDSEISLVRAEQTATFALVTELNRLGDAGVLDEIGNCLNLIYGPAEGGY